MVEPPAPPPEDPRDEPRTAFARVRAGEPVLAELIADNLGRLQAFVRAHMGPNLRAHESDLDLLQSVCGDVLAAHGRFDFRGDAQFRAYLFTAARNKLLERQRHHRAKARDPARERPADTDQSGRRWSPAPAESGDQRAATISRGRLRHKPLTPPSAAAVRTTPSSASADCSR